MTVVTELDDLPVFDYSAPDLTGEVYHRRLAEVAERGWLARGPLSYVVLDREAGEFFLRSRATAFPGREMAALFGVTRGPLWEQIDANILNQTGDHHRRLRSLVGPAFSPRAADRWRPAMRRFLDTLWQEHCEDAASFDFVEAMARPYPALTIATVLGAPQEDVPRLSTWSSWVQKQFDIRALGSELPQIEQAVVEVYDYIEALLSAVAGRAVRGGDLLSALLAAEDEGDRLSHAECVNLVLNLLAGGVDTTQAQLGHALRLFGEHPDQWALLVADPDGLASRAVDEVLRHEPITPFTARLCVEQVGHRGIVFPAGSLVAVCAERANRDVGEEFDIVADRSVRPLTFGAGAHYCLGANLAKAELEEALLFLARRMPSFSLDGPPKHGGVEGIYGMDSLPLAVSQDVRPSPGR